MSDDEDMTDMSQLATQSGSIAYSSFCLSNTEPDREPWGKIIIYKIMRRRLGMHVAQYYEERVRTFELIQERTTFGRKGDCNISDLLVKSSPDISGIHFTIIKNNVGDALCPVFLEDLSKNGTYYRESKQKNETRNQKIDERTKRRILAHKDFIYIERRPTICFEFQSLQLVTNNLPDEINKTYHIGNELGKGACGVVYFAQDRRTCQPFALKYTTSEGDENTVQTILREVDILSRLKHPCILQLFKSKTYVNSVAIFLDFMRGGDLLTRLQNNGAFSESLAKFVFYQMCSGVDYLHSQKITHRDLKPDNILLATTDKYTLVKVSDFGLSKRINTNSVLKTQCGTVMYLAPEVRTANYTNKVDIWSLGIVLYNCLTARYPFHNSNDYQLTFDDDQFRRVSDNGKDIIRTTLRVNAQERPTANELLTKTQWLSTQDKYIQSACEIMKNPHFVQNTNCLK